MRTIEVRVQRKEFVVILGSMRDWLDHHGDPTVRFETESDGDNIAVKVGFEDDALAEAFAQTFRGP